jgi:orotidine-5'-phosphate decarboxylase
MSNPGAHDYMSKTIEGEPIYLRMARDAHQHGCNGFVVGCTATSELAEIRELIGEKRLILSPGLGPQGGDPAAALRLGANSKGERLLVSSSRSIDFAYEGIGWNSEKYAEAAATQAERKRCELNRIKREIFG